MMQLRALFLQYDATSLHILKVTCQLPSFHEIAYLSFTHASQFKPPMAQSVLIKIIDP